MAYEGGYAGAVNLGNPAEITVRELVTRVLRLAGSESQIVSRPLPVDDPQHSAGNAPARLDAARLPEARPEEDDRLFCRRSRGGGAAENLGRAKIGANGSGFLAKMKDAAVPTVERTLIRP